jgi:signal transduction histidine kinase
MHSMLGLKSPSGKVERPPLASPVADRFSVLCALIGIAIGVATAFGWLIGLQGLTNIGVRYIPMAPSTAVCLVLLGTAIILRLRTGLERIVSILFVGAVALFAMAKMIEFWTGWSLGMDEWFVPHPGAFGAVKKARMAPLTAIIFLLSTAAAGSLMRNGLRRIAGILSAMVTTVSIVILLGYVHGTPFLYGGSIIPVAFPTALAFLFIGCSLIAAAGPGSWPLRSLVGSSARAVLLRWFLPVVILGTFANGCVQTLFLKKAGYNPAFVSALSTLGFSLIISAIISKVSQVIGGRIDKAEADRNAAQQSLEALNSRLEEQITERTIELRAKNDALQEALTELISSHEDLKHAQLQLIQAEKMQSIGNLAAGVAHEVKNPLAILGMGLDCLTTQSDLGDDSLKAVLGEMRKAVGRADRIVNALLSYSSRKDLESRECNLEELLENSLLLMRHEFVNRNITVAREFAEELPRCRIDAQKIEQVFINLFTNACHAMPNGGVLTLRAGVKPIAACDVRRDAGDRSGNGFLKDELVLVVTVSDTGTGIPSDKLDRIFDPFFTTKPTGQGTGLGLTVSRKIIELHGGRLELANISQGGVIATVTFRLGCATDHSPASTTRVE